MTRPTQAELLHRHGRPGRWANLGLWPTGPDAPGTDYAGAAEALARRVAQAARLGRGHCVLSLACGAGDELRLWVDGFGAAAAVGVDPAAASPQRDRRIEVLSAAAAALPASHQGFDAVVCVDAAYHLSPRAAFMADAFARLRPGGWLAFTDLVLDDGRTLSPLLRGAARLCGVPAGDLGPAAGRMAQLQQAGFETASAERLDDAVFGGFTAFVQRQRRRLGRDAFGPGWRHVALTAALLPRCRAAGLGYALFAARRPAG